MTRALVPVVLWPGQDLVIAVRDALDETEQQADGHRTREHGATDHHAELYGQFHPWTSRLSEG